MAFQYSGQVTLSDSVVTQLPEMEAIVVYFAGHPDNTQEVYVGNDGADSVSTATGFPLGPASPKLRVRLDGNLNELYAIATVNTEKLCWFLSVD